MSQSRVGFEDGCAEERKHGGEDFIYRGLHHVALVSSDMARTVDFYTKVLGMPLVKTLELPDGGQHFFFGCGNGDCVAFFWYPDSPAVAPRNASAADALDTPASADGTRTALQGHRT